MMMTMKSALLKTVLACALLIGGVTALADGQSAAASDRESLADVSRTLDALL